MHSLLGLAGLLGLIALAFGQAAAVNLARVLIFAVIALFGLFLIDVATHGALSSLI